MFIAYSIAGLLATFLIFSHGHEGGEYTFALGLALIILMVCKKLEKGASLHNILFTLIIYPIIGAVGLGLYQYKNTAMDNLDQITIICFAYLTVYVGVGMLGVVTFLYKLLISSLLKNQIRNINEVNHRIYMSGSSARYLSKKETTQKELLSRKIANIGVFFYILVSTSCFYLARYLPLSSELMAISMDPFKGLVVCCIWYTVVFYVFNCGLVMLGAHLLVAVLAISFNFFTSSSYSDFASMVTALQNVGFSLGMFFLPSLILFFIREFRFIPSFEDY